MPYKDPEKQKAAFRRFHAAHPRAQSGYAAAWYQRNRERILGAQHTARLACLQHYSRAKVPRCRCCGEEHYHFLTLDHIENDGKVHRAVTRDTNICLLLQRRGWPKGFQVLCYNCNFGRAKNGGRCPHKT
jgi:hypothetical protein